MLQSARTQLNKTVLKVVYNIQILGALSIVRDRLCGLVVRVPDC
jgi:hypothetical protein